MSITKTEKELAAVGISIAAGCKPCTDYHMKAVREAGATEDEIRQAVLDAVSVRTAAADVMQNYGFAHMGKPTREVPAVSPRGRVAEFVGLGAAFAVNCVSLLERYIEAAAALGVTTDEIVEITSLAKFIKGKGASHVDRRIGSLAREASSREQQPVIGSA